VFSVLLRADKPVLVLFFTQTKQQTTTKMMAFSAPSALTMNRGTGYRLEQHFDSKKPHFMELPEFNPKTTTVADLKAIVSKMVGIPVEGLVLYSGPVAMINNRLLSEYEHLETRPIVLEPSLQGGCLEMDCTENCGCFSCSEGCCV
jgi:hypothetical protein